MGNLKQTSPQSVAKRMSAVTNAKSILKAGDRIRVSRCGNFKATYTFECWDGSCIVSKSGIDDISAISIYKLNGEPIDFSVPEIVSIAEAQAVISASNKRRNELNSVKTDMSVPF